MFQSDFFRNVAFRMLNVFLFFCILSNFSSDVSAKEIVDPVSVSAASDIPQSDELFVIGTRLGSYQGSGRSIALDADSASANVTYKSREDLDRTLPRNLQEAARDSEGLLFFDQIGNGVDTVMGLRGFADSSSTIVLIDGVRVNEVDGDVVNYPLISLDDLEAFQLDRGSSSPIYGSNAFAGVINLTTGQASEKPWMLFGGTEWTSFNGVRFYNGISGTLEDTWTPLGGKFSYYFRGGRNQADGFRSNGEYRITSFDIKTAYELPEERARFHMGLKHVDDAISNPGALTFDLFQSNPDMTLNPRDGRAMDNTIFQIGVDANFLDHKLTSSMLASWRTNRVEFATTFITFGDFADGFRPDTDLVTTKSRATDFIWQLTYEDSLTDDIDSRTLLGLELRDGKNQANEEDFFESQLRPATATETDRFADPSSFSLFWRETLVFFKKVIAHVGMRHDWHRIGIRDFITVGNSISNRWSNSSVSTGVTYKPIKDVDVFANYSQGFRVPTVSELSPFSGTISTGLSPESSDSYEVGTRLRYKDKAKFRFSYFLIDLKDEIVFDSTAVAVTAPFGQNINIAKSRRTGVETGIQLDPLKELKLYGTYTWTKAYVREINRSGTLVDGRTIGQVPEHRLTWGMESQPLMRFSEKLEGFRVGLHGTYTGKQHPVSYESATQATLNATGGAGHLIKSYTLWDLILSYEWKGKMIYFKVNNLFNNKYYSRSVNATVFGGAFGSGLLAPATYNFVNGGVPREYIVGTKWEWGPAS